jgi:hypothetical protein
MSATPQPGVVAASNLADLLERAAEEVPEPPRSLKRLGFGSLAFFGPGVIIASLTIGSGELVWVPRAVVALGPPILWAIFYGIWVKAVINYMGNKWYALTGETSTHALARVIGPWYVALLGITILAVMPMWATTLGALSANIVWTSAFGKAVDIRHVWIGVVLFTLGVLIGVNVRKKSFVFLEKLKTVILLTMFFLFWVAALFTVRPDWGAILAGMFIPQVPAAYEPWVQAAAPDIWALPMILLIGTALGSLGGGIQDYVGYVAMLKEKGWGLLGSRLSDQITSAYHGAGRRFTVPLPEAPHLVEKLKTRMRAVGLDCFMSYAAVFLVTIPVVILCLYVLRPIQAAPTGLAMFEAQAMWLTGMHPALGVIWWVGAFAAIWGTFYGLWEVYSWTIYDVARTFKRFRDVTVETVKLYLWPYILIASGILFLTGAAIPWLAGFAAALTHLFALALWGFSLVYIDQTQLPKAYRAPIWLVALVIIGAGVYLPFGTIALLQALRLM